MSQCGSSGIRVLIGVGYIGVSYNTATLCSTSCTRNDTMCVSITPSGLEPEMTGECLNTGFILRLIASFVTTIRLLDYVDSVVLILGYNGILLGYYLDTNGILLGY